MLDALTQIVGALLGFEQYDNALPGIEGAAHGGHASLDPVHVAEALNLAFLIFLAGSSHPGHGAAEALLRGLKEDPEWGGVARFYLHGQKAIAQELEARGTKDPCFAGRLESLAAWVSNKENLGQREATAERFWSVFFPEARGIHGREAEAVAELQAKRTVSIEALNPTPISDPGREILFTSNVLLTVPNNRAALEGSTLSAHFKERISRVMEEAQQFWFDHPIHVGVKPEHNEILYGLHGLEAAFDFERRRGNLDRDTKPACVLSISATHRGLLPLAREYIEEELGRSGGLESLQVYGFTEADTERILDEVLCPAASHYLQREDARSFLKVLGVDGEYGRHYSFLKAIAAFWAVFIDPGIRATFKIDLDQVFPQRELEKETGSTAFGHFKTPLWGSRGLGANGDPLEMGMIAGALVDEKDACRSLFIPDVPFPDLRLSPDEYFFYSTLPQALSTQGEMMTCYMPGRLDGERECLQRIHVTGGTNGILVDSLRRYRPFTPSFIGRAEDQALILSVWDKPGMRLAYVHKDGLIMRHDKEAFAAEAVESARVGKLVGDYVRIIIFTGYAACLGEDMETIKEAISPFTGGFVSMIPATVVYLRFGFKAASLFAAGERESGLEFVRSGAERITKALLFTGGDKSELMHIFEKERFGWELYYDILSHVERALQKRDAFALDLQEKASKIINLTLIRA